MTNTRHTITIVAVAALCVSGLLPAAAFAGSLLSGYGGPGEGNQEILGSALVNGPSGKGGAGGGGGSSNAGRASGSIAEGPAVAQSPAAGSQGGFVAAAPHAGRSHSRAAGGSPASGSGARERQLHGAAEKASAGGTHPYSRVYGSSVSHAAAGGSQPLGLSGADELYILLALGMLFLTGALTRRLARANHGDGTAAQAMRRRTRLSN